MSKFDKIFEAREEGRGQAQNEPPTKKKTANTAKKEDSENSQIVKSSKQRGRPTAKRSDPDYLGFTTYIRRDTHLKAKIALLQEGKNRELSELVESLLAEWLKKNNQ